MKCPYCAEEIQANAAKCRFCGEWLDESKRRAKRTMPGDDYSIMHLWGFAFFSALMPAPAILFALILYGRKPRLGTACLVGAGLGIMFWGNYLLGG